MIRVVAQPEPSDFDAAVRRPGRQFLKRVPHPAGKDWYGHDCWRNCSKALRQAYHGICCYAAVRIMPSQSADLTGSVEHFIPKSVEPALAYEWSSFRLASRKANYDRGTLKVLDPFLIQNDWFVLDDAFGTLSANKQLPAELQAEIEESIRNLKLNEDFWVQRRVAYLAQYNKMMLEAQTDKDRQLAADFLQKNAPIVWLTAASHHH